MRQRISQVSALYCLATTIHQFCFTHQYFHSDNQIPPYIDSCIQPDASVRCSMELAMTLYIEYISDHVKLLQRSSDKVVIGCTMKRDVKDSTFQTIIEKNDKDPLGLKRFNEQNGSPANIIFATGLSPKYKDMDMTEIFTVPWLDVYDFIARIQNGVYPLYTRAFFEHVKGSRDPDWKKKIRATSAATKATKPKTNFALKKDQLAQLFTHNSELYQKIPEAQRNELVARLYTDIAPAIKSVHLDDKLLSTFIGNNQDDAENRKEVFLAMLPFVKKFTFDDSELKNIYGKTMENFNAEHVINPNFKGTKSTETLLIPMIQQNTNSTPISNMTNDSHLYQNTSTAKKGPDVVLNVPSNDTGSTTNNNNDENEA